MPDAATPDAELSRREMNLRVFRREPLPRVFFQPRIEPWYAWASQFGTMPPSCRALSLTDVFDDLDASMRYVDYWTGQPYPLVATWSADVKITQRDEPGWRYVTYHTPHGDLQEELEFTVDHTWRTVGFAGRRTEDLPALAWLLARRRWRFDPDRYRLGDAYVGDRGVGQFFLPKSPYLAMAQQWMRFEAFIYALADARDQVEDIFRIIDDSYDELYEQLCACRMTPILNFGENVAEAHMGPAYFREYLLPWYHRRSGQLQRAGLFTHIHIDGYFKSLLPMLRELPHDGLEALTPLPQGDVSLEEIAQHIGDKILLDGIPAVYFLPHHSRDELHTCVERLIELFHPRLVLGISDELPQAADEEGYARLQWVAQRCRESAAPAMA